MKKQQRKSYTTAFKVKIALEAIKGQRIRRSRWPGKCNAPSAADEWRSNER